MQMNSDKREPYRLPTFTSIYCSPKHGIPIPCCITRTSSSILSKCSEPTGNCRASQTLPKSTFHRHNYSNRYLRCQSRLYWPTHKAYTSSKSHFQLRAGRNHHSSDTERTRKEAH